jgi:MoxR-like ATPase
VRFEEVEALQLLLPLVELAPVRIAYAELIQRIRHTGIAISDRRAVKLQRLVAASALLCSRMTAKISDLWILKHIWDTEEQREVLASLVTHALAREAAEADDHPRARAGEQADPEGLARDLGAIAEQLPKADALERAYLRDRLGLLDGRCQWVIEPEKREFLAGQVAELWKQFEP